MKKSRHIYLHPDVNRCKIASLEALHAEYVSYVRICVKTMIEGRKLKLSLAEMKSFFPRADKLTTNIELSAQRYAISIFSSWAKAIYQLSVKKYITKLHRAEQITAEERKALYTVGKCLINVPSDSISPEAIEAYWQILLNQKISGRTPKVSDRIPMRMQETTCRLEASIDSPLAPMWIKISTLVKSKRIWLPLTKNPYIKSVDDVKKGVSARKDKKGRWRFEVLEKEEFKVPDADPSAPKIGVDIGLNVIAATSDGRTFGSDFKPKFDRLYNRVKNLRANRQRQGLKENSKRLDKLEAKLSGMTKTVTGTVVNKLIKKAPQGTVFVIEDLDLRGCRGQKRFAYRALAHNLETKAPTEKVNPAYTSQTCPSCGFVSRSNRKGTDFVCRSCGKRSHADVVGGINLLRRSKEKQIKLDDRPSTVLELLRKRYLTRRNPGRNSFAGLCKDEPASPGRRLTTAVSTKSRKRHSLESDSI